MNIIKKSAVIALASFAIFAGGLSANAGGLFGDGGLIRGDIGNFLDKNVENPITTPAAQAGAVLGGTAVGAIVGGKVGQPAIGGMIGNQMGHCVNDIFAGGNCGNRPANPAQLPVQQGVQQPFPQQQMMPAPSVAWGNFCLTALGRAGPGPVQPVGSFCADVYGNGGYVVQ